jgi:hypothetical protein
MTLDTSQRHLRSREVVGEGESSPCPASTSTARCSLAGRRRAVAEGTLVRTTQLQPDPAPADLAVVATRSLLPLDQFQPILAVDSACWAWEEWHGEREEPVALSVKRRTRSLAVDLKTTFPFPFVKPYRHTLSFASSFSAAMAAQTTSPPHQRRPSVILPASSLRPPAPGAFQDE